MEDIDKEVGALLDNYNKKFEETKINRQERLKENQDFKNTFNQLAESVIKHEMTKYVQLLEKKGFITSIFHETGHQIGSITLIFSYRGSSYPEFIPPIIPVLKPALKFATQNRKISVYENKFGPSGSGCSSKEGTYETYQITESFVMEKLSNFFKSLLDKEWSLSDFE